MQQRGPHQLVSSKKVYANPWITVREDRIVRSNGQEGVYGVVEYSPGVVTVALTPDKRIYLVQEYLYAADSYSPCLPGGGIDPGETPQQAAEKELREEAGAKAEEWISLGYIEPFPMVMNAKQHLFLAFNARVVAEQEEEFTRHTVSIDDAVAMVMRGEIIHGASSQAILRAKLYLDRSVA
jgi:8-oxo-dGTP pyrophosphatase MutT (NUDIX family)